MDLQTEPIKDYSFVIKTELKDEDEFSDLSLSRVGNICSNMILEEIDIKEEIEDEIDEYDDDDDMGEEEFHFVDINGVEQESTQGVSEQVEGGYDMKHHPDTSDLQGENNDNLVLVEDSGFNEKFCFVDVHQIKQEPEDIYSELEEEVTPIHYESRDGVAMRYSCDHCKETFNHKRDLRKHINNHMNKTKYSCQYCKKSFHNRRLYSVHLKTHSGVKYGCKFCGKNFNLPSKLYDHAIVDHYKVQRNSVNERSYSNARNFICPYCSKSFRKKTVFTKHITLHTNIATYECKYCGKPFNATDTFFKHVKDFHQNELLYKCRECTVSFSRQSDLSRHLQKFHAFHPKEANLQFKCHQCPRLYRRKGDLTVHLKKCVAKTPE